MLARRLHYTKVPEIRLRLNFLKHPLVNGPQVNVRNVFHGVVAALLWILYAYYWSIVGRRPLNPSTITALVALGVVSGLTITILIVWIYHNIRISRRYQRRTVRPPGPATAARDYVGRWIVCDDPAALLTAAYIEVDIKISVVEERMVEEKIFSTARTK